MASKRHLRQKVCARKDKYPSYACANSAMLSAKARGVVFGFCKVYPCPFAHPVHYHYGHIKKTRQNMRSIT